jgi:hypothetical protein
VRGCQPLDLKRAAAEPLVARSARKDSRSGPAGGGQPIAAGHAGSARMKRANGRDLIPSSCSHGISPPPGFRMLYGRLCGRFYSELVLTSRRHHQSRSDALPPPRASSSDLWNARAGGASSAAVRSSCFVPLSSTDAVTMVEREPAATAVNSCPWPPRDRGYPHRPVA